MNNRERIKSVLEYKIPDKIPIQDSVWESTVERWYNEGFPLGVKVEDYFNYEVKYVYLDITLQFTFEVLGETDEYIIERNTFGEVIKNHKDRSTTSTNS